MAPAALEHQARLSTCPLCDQKPGLFDPSIVSDHLDGDQVAIPTGSLWRGRDHF